MIRSCASCYFTPIIASLVLVGPLCGIQQKGQPKQLRGPDVLRTGDPAPDFSIQDVAGKKTVKLSDLKGAPVVLIFGSCT